MMERQIRDLTDEIDGLAERLGRLPEAPLAMPKQRLEGEAGLIAFLGRLIGRGDVAVGSARHSGS